MFYCQFYHLYMDFTDSPNEGTLEIRHSFDVNPQVFYFRR